VLSEIRFLQDFHWRRISRARGRDR